MKILHVIHDIDPRTGGPTSTIQNVVRAQCRRGHRVSLLTTSAQYAEPWMAREEYIDRVSSDPAYRDVELYIGRAYGRGRLWSTYAYSPDCRDWLRRRLADRALVPEVVHIHGVFSHLTNLAAVWSRARHIPYIIRPAGSLDLECYRSGRQVLKRLYTRVWLGRDLRGAAYVHVTAPAEERELQRWLPGSRIKLVPSGANLPVLNPEAARAGFLAAYPQLRGRRILLHMARINKIKRLELLVEALDTLRGEYPDLVLLVAGNDGGHRQVVEQAVDRLGLRDRVVFADFLVGELKQWAFENASLFALPSSHENFGVAVVEAMAHGVPVLVTPGVASHIHVDASGCGLTVAGDAPSIAQGICRLLAADRNDLGKKGADYVAEHLSWTQVARQLETLYELAVTQKRQDAACRGACGGEHAAPEAKGIGKDRRRETP